jgi:hypothetical protein
MTQPTTPPTPSVTWRRRALRRTAGSLGAAVVISGIAPAVANAAGAHVANPMAYALRASGDTLASALGMDETSPTTTADPCVSATPTESVEPTVEPSESVEPGESVEPSESGAPSESAVPSDSAEPTLEPTESVLPTDTTTESTESSEPTVEPTASDAPESAEPSDDTTCAEPSESPSPEPTESDAADDHGLVVSTVAHCAPHGKDALLAVDGAPAHHGGYVSVAAHGGTLTTPWGTFDLSTKAGADDLCAALAAARDALPTTAAAIKPHGKHAKPEHAKPAKAAHAHGNGHAKHGGHDGTAAESGETEHSTDGSTDGSTDDTSESGD